MGQKLNETYINSLVEKIINETIHEKAEQIERQLKGKDTKKGKKFPDLTGDGKVTYADILKGRGVELGEGNEVCECGAPIYEGECTECGYGKSSMEEGIYDVEAGVDFPEDQEFDYVEEEEDMDVIDFEDYENQQNKEFCKYQKEKFREDDPIYQEKCSSMKELARKPISMNEKLHGKQKNIDKNKNGRIDAEDFKMLRKGSVEEGEKFIQKAMSKMEKKGTEGSFKEYCGGEVTKSCIDKAMKSGDPKLVKKANFAKNIKAYKGAEHKESITMTEGELINFIEKIIKEELKTTTKHKGLATYEKAHKGSGKENEDYLKSVTKKMKEYLKDGSKGDYETEPDFFPKGNGELGDMKKKAYIPSDSIKDYVDNLTAAGQENLDYDEIHPNEDWVSDNVEGSSRTGNNPDWANTGKSEVNKKRNEIRKKNMLAKIKRKAYNKAPQPVVTDETGDTGTGKLMMKLESENEKTNQKLNEEFDRMKQLLGYSKKTQ